jgi:hypothetical protein
MGIGGSGRRRTDHILPCITHTCQGVPSPRGCNAGLAVHSEPSRGQAKLPRGRCRRYCVGEACVGGLSPCPTLPSYWSMQHPLRAQFFCQGGSHPPRTFAGGAYYATFHHVGGSDLTLLLSGGRATSGGRCPGESAGGQGQRVMPGRHAGESVG